MNFIVINKISMLKKVVLTPLILLSISCGYAQQASLSTVIQEGHKTSINSLAYAPDGERFVSHSYSDNSLMIWSKQGLLIRKIPLPYEMSIDYASDGKFLLGRDDLYDLEGRKVLELSPGMNNGVSCSKMSPDGTLIALGLDNTNIPDKRKIRILDRQGKIVRLIDGTNHMPRCIAFSADGKMLAIGAGSVYPLGQLSGHEEPLDPTCEVVIMTIEGTILKVLPVAKDVKAVTFSPDGQKVVAVVDDGKVMNWKIDGTQISESKGDILYDVSYSPDNKYFVVIGASSLTLYDPNGVVIRTFKDQASTYGSSFGGSICQFSPDSKYILACDAGEIYILDVNGSVVKRIPQFNSSQMWTSIHLMSPGDLFYSGSELWSMQGKRIVLPPSRYGYVFSDDGQYAATWDGSGAKVIAIDGSRSFNIPGASVARFTKEGIIAHGGDYRIKKTARFDYHGKFIDSVKRENPEVYSADRKFYFTSTYRGLDLFDATGKKLKSFYNPDSAAVKSVEARYEYVTDGGLFSPDGKVLAQHVSKGIQLYQVPSGKPLATLSTVTYLSTGYEINDGAHGNGMRSILSNKTKKIFFSQDSERIYILGFYRLYSYDLKGNKVLEGPDISARGGSFPEIAVSPDESFLISCTSDKKLNKISIKTGELLAKSKQLEVTVSQMIFTSNGKTLLTKDDNAKVRLWNTETLEEIASFYGLGDSDYAIVTPDGYYSASKNAGRYMHFSKDLKTFTFDNFDLTYNRPDIVVKRLGMASDEMVEGLRNAYLKRLKKMGFTEEQVTLDVHLPEIQILTKNIPVLTDSKFLTTQIKVSDSKYLLDRINIYVNEVPLFGLKGLSVKDLKTSDLTRDVRIELVNGRNLIQFAVMNEKGAESIKETVEIQYNGPVVKPVLYVVAIGVSDYSDNTYDLKYASKDATDLASLLATNKTNYAEVKVLKIVDTDATKENIRKAKEFLNASRVDDQVVLFVAGHGLLDDDMNFYFATTNVEFASPAAQGLPYEDLEALLDGIPARKKLMLIDACHSGEVDKEETVFTNGATNQNGGSVAARGFKNVTRKESVGLKNSFELMNELFTDLRRGSGAVVISSASGVEFAFESDAWKNGVFTYSVLEGLKSNSADKNGNQEIQVSELRDYVIQRVAELTQGKQHPTSRKENLEFDFKVW
jgi:WD40 repeat protein/uncharacterized caspase-like protein